jgi:hypothetical protein
MSDVTLVVMRLKDMGRVHPDQDNSRLCSQCGEPVGVYPSGQAALRDRPDMRIVCHVCAHGGQGAKSYPAAPWDEIICEIEESEDAP